MGTLESAPDTQCRSNSLIGSTSLANQHDRLSAHSDHSHSASRNIGRDRSLIATSSGRRIRDCSLSICSSIWLACCRESNFRWVCTGASRLQLVHCRRTKCIVVPDPFSGLAASLSAATANDWSSCNQSLVHYLSCQLIFSLSGYGRSIASLRRLDSVTSELQQRLRPGRWEVCRVRSDRTEKWHQYVRICRAEPVRRN